MIHTAAVARPVATNPLVVQEEATAAEVMTRTAPLVVPVVV